MGTQLGKVYLGMQVMLFENEGNLSGAQITEDPFIGWVASLYELNGQPFAGVSYMDHNGESKSVALIRYRDESEVLAETGEPFFMKMVRVELLDDETVDEEPTANQEAGAIDAVVESGDDSSDSCQVMDADAGNTLASGEGDVSPAESENL